MFTDIQTELQHRDTREQYRETRALNLGARLVAHFGIGFLHNYKRKRATSVDTNRVNRFHQWLAEDDSRNLFAVNLSDYADDVLEDNAEVSKVSVLGTIRGCVRRFVASSECMDYITDMVDLWEDKDDESQALTIAQGIQRRILKRVASDKFIRVAIKRDHTQAILKGTRIAHEDMKYTIKSLWAQDELSALRDSAIVALLGGFGLRSEEALNVHVNDFADGHLRVRKGKGAKERSIPYASGYFYYKVVMKWLEASGITEGLVLRSINRWGTIGDSMSYRALKDVLEKSQFMVEASGELISPLPHDYRKSAARMWFEAGMSIYDIAQNLGHTNSDGQLNIELTSQYIGLTGSESRMLKLA